MTFAFRCDNGIIRGIVMVDLSLSKLGMGLLWNTMVGQNKYQVTDQQ